MCVEKCTLSIEFVACLSTQETSVSNSKQIDVYLGQNMRNSKAEISNIPKNPVIIFRHIFA